MRLTLNELRNIIKEVVKEENLVKKYSNQFGWGVRDQQQPSSAGHQWHHNQPVFRKFMKEMFGIEDTDDNSK